MGRVVFLLEEPSMVECLRAILPKLFPNWVENVDWIPVPHNGKSELERSIPKKIRGWQEPGVRFLILRDNDQGDCRKLKAKLMALAESGRTDANVLVRIVCQELESWFLGDLDAVKSAYPKAQIQCNYVSQKFRNPDLPGNAAEELAKLTKTRVKVARAVKIGGEMRLDHNRSRSFNVFLDGLRRMCDD